MNYLSSGLLTDYTNQFCGVGSWTAKVWFIGIEEVGGESIEEVQTRLRVWDERGKRSLENAPVFYPACGLKKWHGPEAKLQDTWKQLTRMLLLARGERDSEKALLDYQRNGLGAANGQTCLTELLPLPSPNTEDWAYDGWSSLEWLANRTFYMKQLRAKRTNLLKERVSEHRPAVVIFYGTSLPGGISLLPIWIQIAGGARFQQAIERKRILLYQNTEHTQFFVTRHPATETGGYFKEIGRFLRKEYGKSF